MHDPICLIERVRPEELLPELLQVLDVPLLLGLPGRCAISCCSCRLLYIISLALILTLTFPIGQFKACEVVQEAEQPVLEPTTDLYRPYTTLLGFSPDGLGVGQGDVAGCEEHGDRRVQLGVGEVVRQPEEATVDDDVEEGLHVVLEGLSVLCLCAVAMYHGQGHVLPGTL